MSRKLLIVFCVFVLLGAGCTITPDTATPSGFSHYNNPELGLSFDHPTTWGPVDVKIERGYSNQEVFDASGEPDCVYQRAVMFEGIGENAVLLTAVNNDKSCLPTGRGAYWGDMAQGLWIPYEQTESGSHYQIIGGEIGWTGPRDSVAYESFFTASGELVEHATVPVYKLPFTTETLADVDFYALYHDTNSLSSILLSDERLISSGSTDHDASLRTLAGSITFVE